MRQRLYYSSDLFANYSYDAVADQGQFKLHTHSFAEILLFLKGKAIFHVEGSSYPMQPGDIFITRPTEAHYVEVSPDIPYERMVVNFDFSLLENMQTGAQLLQPFLGRDAGQLNRYRAEDFPDSRYAEHIQDLRRYPEDRLASIADLILCLTEINRQFHVQKDTADQPNTLENRIIGYINCNLWKPLSLEMLCQIFFVSRAQLCRRFQKATGSSVGRYITAKRLLHAQQMIQKGYKPTEVHTLCGFQDYSTFYRAFTKYFGCSPKDECLRSPAPDNNRQLIP
ncbi:MAG: helix-turn-helix domain-containing protein [Ruminococcaceae bacterium]|nr:helix-turn-helix domain-containing protein [Oscillospiraceae bacterium]